MEEKSKYIEILNKFLEADPNSLNLHLGCGNHIYDNFVNIDKYTKDPRITSLDMQNLPYKLGEVQRVYSSHSLEHIAQRRQILTLMKWTQLLKKGGELLLAVPDLEQICRNFIDPNIPLRDKLNWHIFTLFGYQIDTENLAFKSTYEGEPFDEGQVHYGGFTREILEHVMTDCGMEVKELFSYDGWGTPSLCLLAVK